MSIGGKGTLAAASHVTISSKRGWSAANNFNYQHNP